MLAGIERSIQQYHPYVLFEYNEDMWGTANLDFSTCDKFFAKQEYTLYVLYPNNSLTRVKHGLPKSANIFAVPPVV